MIKIARPVNPPAHPDYDQDCQAALEPAVENLAAAAERAEWDTHAVARALLEICLARLLAYGHDTENVNLIARDKLRLASRKE